MKRYICEFEVFESEGVWCAEPHGLAGGTQGASLADAVESAADWLRLEAESAAMRGVVMPEPVLGAPLVHGGERVVVSVVAGRDTIETVSGKKAAKLLGVSKKQVRKMLDKAQLEGWRDGKKMRITMASVEARLQEGRGFSDLEVTGYLETPGQREAYLAAAEEFGDEEALAEAREDVARAAARWDEDDFVADLLESLEKPAPPMMARDDPEEHEALIAEALDALNHYSIRSAEEKYKANNRCTARRVANLCAILAEAGRIEDIARVGEDEDYRDRLYAEFEIS